MNPRLKSKLQMRSWTLHSFFLLLWYIPIFAQLGSVPRLLHLQTVIPIPPHLTINRFEYTATFTGDALWLYPGEQSWTQTVWLYRYHSHNQRWDSIRISVWDSLLMEDLLQRPRRSLWGIIPMFSNGDTLIAIGAGRRLYICTFHPKDTATLVLHHSFALYSSERLQPIPGVHQVWLSHCAILSSRTEDTSHTVIERYDGNTGKFQRISLPDPEGIWLTYFQPPFPPAVTSWGIAVPEITAYRIRIYQWNKLLHSVVQRNALEWDTTPLIQLQDTLQQLLRAHKAISIIRLLRPAFYQQLNSIQRVEFLTDSLLLVIWWQQDSLPQTPAARIADLWKLDRTGQWQAIATDIFLPTSPAEIRGSPLPLWSDWFCISRPYILLPGEIPGMGQEGIYIWKVNPAYWQQE